MPRKKEKYSTLDQIVNALLKKEKLDDSKYQELQSSIKIIIAANVDDVVRDYLNRCLAIKQDISNLLISINEANTSGAIEGFNKKISSIDNEIKEIDINQIKLGIETKKVKTQIKSIKEDFQPNIEKFKERLKQKENELEEEKKMVQAQKELSDASSSETSSDQSPIKETGTVSQKRGERDEKRYEQHLQEQEKHRKKGKQKSGCVIGQSKAQKEDGIINTELYALYYQLTIIMSKVVNTMHNDIIRVNNRKNNTASGTMNMPDKEYKVFDSILQCYIKVYYTSTIMRIIIRMSLGNIQVISTDAQDKFERLQHSQKAPFEKLLSIFRLKQSEAKIKDKVKNIESNFEAAINVLSKYVVDLPISLYSNIPCINNIDKIKNNLINDVVTISTSEQAYNMIEKDEMIHAITPKKMLRI
ncbi:hypothetical protein [Candidatus Mesenet endosymbiont of Agriotes lineatus]|uniref:hypothetical protein n=1 Tax=Candidatus Mesenet endosymbiont of Agriotes lineatus TaxID=3077948 RepID=UPI0030D4A9BF